MSNLNVLGVLLVVDEYAEVADRVVQDAKELKVAGGREVGVGRGGGGAGRRCRRQTLLEEVAQAGGQLVGDDERVVRLHAVRAQAERVVLQVGVQELEEPDAEERSPLVVLVARVARLAQYVGDVLHNGGYVERLDSAHDGSMWFHR